MANDGNFDTSNFYPSECQQNTDFRKFANDLLLSSAIRVLRRSLAKNRHFIEGKDTHFSQISQAIFEKLAFSKKLRRVKGAINS